MKRLATAVAATALLMVGAAAAPRSSRPPAPPAPPLDLAAFVAPEAPPASLVVEGEPGRADDLAATLATDGWRVLRRVDGLVEVALEGDAAAAASRLAALPGVRSISAPRPAVPSAVDPIDLPGSGVYGGEGARAIGVPTWRAADLTGKGTRLAVIDTGFGDWDRAAAAGEVPALQFDPARDIDLCNEGFNHTNHGTATAEILNDVAPDVDLVRVCIDDALDLAQAVPELIARHVDVVNMSLGFYNTARGDGRGGPGSPDQSVRSALAAGILWVNSAGNEALVHWGGAFTDTNGDGRHEWQAGQPTMAFTLPPGSPVTAYLKWDDWNQPSSDFALCLSSDPQGSPQCYPGQALTKGTPTVAVGLTNTLDHDVTLYASVQRTAGTLSPRLDAFFLGARSIQYPVPQSSLAEPAAVDGVITVGAVCTTTGEIRPYSSEGPTLDGRLGVSVAAPGSVSGFLFGPAEDCQGGYGGTSAAAPHVAGALALIRQDQVAPSDAAVLSELLQRTSAAGDPGQAGPDPVYGYGVLRLGVPASPQPPPTTTTTTTTPPPTTAPPGSTTTTTGPSSTTTSTVPPAPTPPPSTVPPPTTPPPTPPTSGFGLALSDHADRSGARPFTDPTLSGDAYVFLTPVFPAQAPAEVRFLVDGRLVQVEKAAGYDLGGGMADRAYPFDTFRLADGPHRLDVRLRFSDGHDESLQAPFTVDNAGRPRPASPFQLVVSSDPLGAASQPLDGATVSGAVHMSLIGTPPAAVDHVLFYVDADLVGYDQDAPYELGATLGRADQGFDTARLGPGEHMSQVIVFLGDGGLLTVNATFTVA